MDDNPNSTRRDEVQLGSLSHRDSQIAVKRNVSLMEGINVWNQGYQQHKLSAMESYITSHIDSPYMCTFDFSDVTVFLNIVLERSLLKDVLLIRNNDHLSNLSAV